MKIEAVRAGLVDIGSANAVYVQIETSNGLTGVGETVLKRREATVLSNVREIGDWLIGKDPLRTEDLAEQLYRDSFWAGGPLHAAGRSAIDIALWDLKGKYLGAPVYQLLGGPTRARIPIYSHCDPGESPEEFVTNAQAIVDRGVRRIKTKLPIFYGGGARLSTGNDLARDFELAANRPIREAEYLPTWVFEEIARWFAMAREHLGWNVELMLDCRGRLSLASALRLSETLSPYRLLFLEEPLQPEFIDGYRQLIQRSPIPIAAGERLASLYDARGYLESGAVNIIQTDPVTSGGITASKKIAALAEAYGVPYAPHNPNGPVATLAAAHVVFSVPNAYMLEVRDISDEGAVAGRLLEKYPTVENGYLSLSDAPGLGASLLEGALDQDPAPKVTDGR